MKVRKYFIISFLFLAIVCFGSSFYLKDFYTIRLFNDLSLGLPLYVWVIVPAAVLFLVTTIYMSFYKFKSYFSRKNLERDYSEFIKNARSMLLSSDKKFTYKTKFFEFPGKLVSSLRIDYNFIDNLSNIKEIEGTYSLIKKIRTNELVDTRKTDLFSLDKNNPLVLRNMENRLHKDKKYSENILRKTDKNSKLYHEAAKVYLSYAPNVSDIKKMGIKITKDMLFIVLDRFCNTSKNSIKIDRDDILFFIQEVDDLDKRSDFIQIAKNLIRKLPPSDLIVIFEKLSDDNTLALEAYLYILFEVQMIDKARDIIDSSKDDESCLKFKYLLFLKDNHQSFDVSLFI